MRKQADAPAHDEGRKRTVYPAAVVSALTLLVYLPALRNDFLNWDDGLYVNNPRIRSLNWEFLKWAITDSSTLYWHPLTWISHALDYALWGLNPMGHHITNIALHAINTFIVVCLVIRLVDAAKADSKPSLYPHDAKAKSSTPKRVMRGRDHDSAGGEASFFPDERAIMVTAVSTGLLFGLHPMHVESVAWIAERKDLLYSLFFMLSIMAYTKYARSLNIRPAAKDFYFNRHYYLSFALFFFSLMGKPMAVSLPVVLLILDWYPFRRIQRPRHFIASIVEKVPFGSLSILVAISTLKAQKGVGAMELLETVPLHSRILVALKSTMMYLLKMIAPFNLSPFYPYPKEIAGLSPGYIFSAAFVIGITATCLIIAKKRPLWSAVWGYYIVMLLPVLGIVQVGWQSMADRFIYLPSVGPFLLLGLAASLIWAKADSMKQRKTWLRFVAAWGIALCIAMSYATLKQITVWRNTMALWNYVIEEQACRVSFAYVSRGSEFRLAGQHARAMEDFNMAITLDPSSADAYINRAAAFYDTDQLDKAIDDLDRAIVLKPDKYLAYNNRAIMLKEKGRTDKSIEDLNKAIALKPVEYLAYYNRGTILKETGHADQALEDFSKAIALNPYFISAYESRAVLFREKGRLNEAIEDYNKEISLNPDDISTYMDRGTLHEMIGRKVMALKDYQKVCDKGNKAGCDAISTLEKR